jgi:hypothetical protein
MIMRNDRDSALATVSGETAVSARVLTEPVQDLENRRWCFAVLRNPEADRYPVTVSCREFMP